MQPDRQPGCHPEEVLYFLCKPLTLHTHSRTIGRGRDSTLVLSTEENKSGHRQGTLTSLNLCTDEGPASYLGTSSSLRPQRYPPRVDRWPRSLSCFWNIWTTLRSQKKKVLHLFTCVCRYQGLGAVLDASKMRGELEGADSDRITGQTHGDIWKGGIKGAHLARLHSTKADIS